jgi:integrase
LALVKAMRAARERAGVPNAVCYSARHTFATDSLAAGLSDGVTAELLGHASTRMLRNYAHLAAKADALRAALARVRPADPPNG